MNETTTALEARLASEVEALRGDVARLNFALDCVRRDAEAARDVPVRDDDHDSYKAHAASMKRQANCTLRILDLHAPVKPDLGATQRVTMRRQP